MRRVREKFNSRSNRRNLFRTALTLGIACCSLPAHSQQTTNNPTPLPHSIPGDLRPVMILGGIESAATTTPPVTGHLVQLTQQTSSPTQSASLEATVATVQNETAQQQAQPPSNATNSVQTIVIPRNTSTGQPQQQIRVIVEAADGEPQVNAQSILERRQIRVEAHSADTRKPPQPQTLRAQVRKDSSPNTEAHSPAHPQVKTVDRAPSKDTPRNDGPPHPPHPGFPGGQPPFGPPGMDMRLPMDGPPHRNPPLHDGRSFDEALESPAVQKVLALLKENYELKADMKIQEVKLDAQATIAELKLEIERHQLSTRSEQLEQFERALQGRERELERLQENLEREGHEIREHREGMERGAQQAHEELEQAEKQFQAQALQLNELRDENLLLRKQLGESLQRNREMERAREELKISKDELARETEILNKAKSELEHRSRLLEAKLQDVESRKTEAKADGDAVSGKEVAGKAQEAAKREAEARKREAARRAEQAKRNAAKQKQDDK